MKIKELALGLALGFALGVYVQHQPAEAVTAGSTAPVQDVQAFIVANDQGDTLVAMINPVSYVASSSGTLIIYTPPAGKKASLSLILNGTQVDE